MLPEFPRSALKDKGFQPRDWWHKLQQFLAEAMAAETTFQSPHRGAVLAK
jgi:hypothetical protein